jgi:oligoribonuclease (3'-5' exoribonuclease)
MDRLFMQQYLPEVDKYLHYRIVDVSTIKELCRYVYLKQRKVIFLYYKIMMMLGAIRVTVRQWGTLCPGGKYC